jgi:glutamate-1-semialdehyde 2,1-aminomutase
MNRLQNSARENELLAQAQRYLPGGVLGSAVAPEDLAFVVKRAQGSRVWDFSGREYIDHLLSSGPMILGHAHPAVVEAIRHQAEAGTSYFWLSEPLLELAAEICRSAPCAEQVRFTSSGTEATFFALRAARAFRRRSKIMKFEGAYHGSHDYASMSVAPKSPKAFPAPTPDTAGIPPVVEGEVLIAPYNDLATVESLLAVYADDLAAVIVEPFQRLIAPQPGFLQGLRTLTRRHGVPLIFDEVVTGYRFAYGGASEFYGVTPDLAAYGKILGGGLPMAAVAGNREIMQAFDPRLEGVGDFVSQIGTLNGNALAAAAGLATLGELRKPGAYARLHALGRTLKDGLSDLVARSGLPAQVLGETTMFDVVFTDRPVTDYRALLTADEELTRSFRTECLKGGVLRTTKIYVSLAHSEDDIARALEIFERALAALPRRAARPSLRR